MLGGTVYKCARSGLPVNGWVEWVATVRHDGPIERGRGEGYLPGEMGVVSARERVSEMEAEDCTADGSGDGERRR